MTVKAAIVVGAGAMGLAAGWALARGGVRVTILDPCTEQGGSAGGAVCGWKVLLEELHRVDLQADALALGFPREPTFEILGQMNCQRHDRAP